jgi:type I restriction enzyme S subunit
LSLAASNEFASVTAKWKRYPAYKGSGVEWLGQIPSHWEVKRVKFIAPLQGGYAFKSEAFSEDGVPVVRMNNLKRGKLDFEDAGFVSEADCIPSFALREGDVLLGMSGSIGETGSLGNFAVVREQDLPCQLNQRVGRFRLQPQIERGFLIHFIQSASFSNPLIAIATSTAQFNISPGDVGNLDIPLPPPLEQRAIAAFLDCETAKIDALVAKKERLIVLLQEKRSALITCAVTKGLPSTGSGQATPNVPMKDSGVEWLGEIPAHWDVKRVKWAAKMESGHTPDKKVEAYWADGDVPWVSLNDSGYLRDHDYIADTAYYTTPLASQTPPRGFYPRDQ